MLALCVACQSPSDNHLSVLSLARSTVKIEALRQPHEVERSVSLTGSVIQRLAILNGWLYQIDDGTGQLWIMTENVAPAVGNSVDVDGILRYEAIIINDADLGDYYLEEKQLQQLSGDP
ncbi:hypothetical protein [Leptothoe sp. PORK10 BA2]|uniref:hypothetical protein n=1 Tax=Leptothoe sp. PORK10 BA2 TaxID=3110254 RepID=UPI002B1F494A|nr:hypothetical protein [Leptothoe sp. PORK10 BA2]MEA5462229.1 hypothetical protein [Leptothoe sp. PORK10 BA2]